MIDYHNLYHKLNSINNLEPFHILISLIGNEKEKNTTLFLKHRFYQFFLQRISSLFWY